MKSKSYIAAFVAAVFGTMMFAAPAVAGGHHYPPPPEKCYESVVDVPEHTVQVLVSDAIPGIPAVPETFTTVAGPWYVWAPTVADGPQDYTPAFPTDDERGKWVGPKTEGGPDRTEEGTFNVSHGQSGNSSWFHRGPSTQVGNGDGKPAVPAVDAVYRTDTIPATYKDVEVECPDEDIPVAAQFNVDADEPTCDLDGFLDTTLFPIEREGYTLTVDRDFDGPGDYVITAVPDDNYVITGPTSVTITVLPRDEGLCGPPPECVDGQQPVWHVWNGGPTDTAPAVDADGWHAVPGEPQSDNHSVPPRVYGEPYNVSNGQSGKSSWFLWTLEDSDDCTVEPATISPNPPVVKDLCGTEDDHYGLPTGPAGITYTRGTGEGMRDIIATITAADTVWGLLGEGWVETSDTTAVFTFDSEAFTDVPCVEPPCEVECPPFPTGIPFSAPAPAPTCTEGATFDAGDLGGEFNEETQQYEFETVDAEVLFDEETNEVTINVFAHEGYVIDESLLEDEGWFVEAGGARASITFELAAATGTQSTNAAAPCYVAPPVTTPPTVVTVTNPLTPTPATYYVYSSNQLASTGSEGVWALGALAALLLLIGGSATAVAVRNRK